MLVRFPRSFFLSRVRQSSSVMRRTWWIVALATVFFFRRTDCTNVKRVVGGRAAFSSFVRHLAYIQIITFDEFYYSCTGTVIGERWVLTAAHCVDVYGTRGDADKTKTFVYIGSNKTTPEKSARKYYLDNIYLHKRFQTELNDFRNDVALLKLQDPIATEDYYPVKIGTAPENGSVVTAVGYGSVDEAGTPALKAMQTRVVTQAFDSCFERETWSIQEVLDEEVQICATSIGFPRRGVTDTCYGDSGGPLFYENKNKTIVQFASTSFSTGGCAEVGGVAWYSRLSRYEVAIAKVVDGRFDSDFRKMNSSAERQSDDVQVRNSRSHDHSRIGAKKKGGIRTPEEKRQEQGR
ncbi:unnamed protein product [Agarophyton chilense]